MQNSHADIYEVDFMNLVVDKADDLKVVDCDRHFTEFAGVHISKIHQGKLDLMNLILPVYRETVLKTLCKKDSPFVYFDAEFFDKNGESVFIHCTGQNYDDSTLCRLTLVDVSRSQQYTQELQAHAVRMDTLIDRIRGGVCVLKVNGEMHIEVIYINDGACRMFGTTKAAFSLGKYHLDELIHPEDRSAVNQAIGRCMATGEPMELVFRTSSKRQSRRLLLRGDIDHYEDDAPVFYAALTDMNF